MLKLAESLTRALLEICISYHVVGDVVESPLLFHLLDIRARNGKNDQELVRTHCESISVNLSLKSRMRSPEAISGQI